MKLARPSMRLDLAFPTLVGVVAAYALGGCSGGPSPDVRTVKGADCIDLPGTIVGETTGGLTFALTDPVDAEHLPVPRNDAEAIVFRYLYETALEIDCRGKVRPGLFSSWKSSAGGRIWTLRLRPGARFADGSPVRAADVERGWMKTRQRAREQRRDAWYWDVVRPEVVSAPDDETLIFDLDAPVPDLPDLLGLPEFYVFREVPVPDWPLGTRDRRAVTRSRPGDLTSRYVTCRDASGKSVATFEALRGSDPRDVLAAGIDASLVRSRSALHFLARFPDVRISPLPWTRLYVLLGPNADELPPIGPETREELARDVVEANARPATSWLLEPRTEPERWPLTDAQPDTAAADLAGTRESRADGGLVYVLMSDPDAKRLAERIAFLWLEANPSTPVRVSPLPLRALREVMREGTAAAYVVAVQRGVASAELQFRDLLESAPWLASTDQIVPLVETRAHLVTRERLTGIVTGYDGIPRLHGAGWTRTEAALP